MFVIRARVPSNLFFFIAILCTYLSAWIIQSTLILNYDVSWLSEASRRMLAGGTYTKDFFENNPPLILYLYAPPVLLTQFLHINIITTQRFYIFFIAILSFLICYNFTQRLFLKEDHLLAKAFGIAFLFACVILPLYEFGQRENLFFMLVTPYLLMLACRLQNKAINPYYAGTIGFLAGLGFFLKPYFLMTLALIELYYISRRKNILAWFRPEIITMVFLLAIYLLVILFRHSDYIFVVMPYALRWCYLSCRESWQILLCNPVAIFCLIPFLLFTLNHKKNPYIGLMILLILAVAGSLFSYGIQQTLYYYHILPALSFTLLSLLLFIGTQRCSSYSKIDYLLVGLIFALNIFFIWHFIPAIWTMIIFHPPCFFIYFTSLFFIFIYLFHGFDNTKNKLALIFAVIASILGSYSFYSLLQSTNFIFPQFILTILWMVCIFSYILRKMLFLKYQYIIIFLMSLCIFAFPYYYCCNIYYNKIYSLKQIKKIGLFIQQHASNKSVYFFSSTMIYTFPYIHYGNNTVYAPRFSYFFGLPGTIKHIYLNKYQGNNSRSIQDANFIITMVTEDLVNTQPDFIFVDTSQYKSNFWVEEIKSYGKILTFIPFDYISYFSKNKNFAHEWEKYHYFTSLKGNEPYFYQFKVFRRIDNT